MWAEFWPAKQLNSAITSGVVVVVVDVVEAVVVGNSPLFLSWAKIRHENPVAVFLPLLRNLAMTLKKGKIEVALFVCKYSEKIRIVVWINFHWMLKHWLYLFDHLFIKFQCHLQNSYQKVKKHTHQRTTVNRKDRWTIFFSLVLAIGIE